MILMDIVGDKIIIESGQKSAGIVWDSPGIIDEYLSINHFHDKHACAFNPLNRLEHQETGFETPINNVIDALHSISIAYRDDGPALNKEIIVRDIRLLSPEHLRENHFVLEHATKRAVNTRGLKEEAEVGQIVGYARFIE